MKNLQLFAFLKFPRECFRTAVIEIKQLKKMALTVTKKVITYQFT
jgi:hypothetical protein